MAELSNYLENKLLDHILKNVSYTSPTTVYVGLFTSDPTDAGSGTEIHIFFSCFTQNIHKIKTTNSLK